MRQNCSPRWCPIKPRLPRSAPPGLRGCEARPWASPLNPTSRASWRSDPDLAGELRPVPARREDPRWRPPHNRARPRSRRKYPNGLSQSAPPLVLHDRAHTRRRAKVARLGQCRPSLTALKPHSRASTPACPRPNSARQAGPE